MVNVLAAGGPFGTEGAAAMGIVFGPLYFNDLPVFDMGINAAVGEGITDRANGRAHIDIAACTRNLAASALSGVYNRFCTHDVITPFGLDFYT
jgi:hypothetical protein